MLLWRRVRSDDCALNQALKKVKSQKAPPLKSDHMNFTTILNRPIYEYTRQYRIIPDRLIRFLPRQLSPSSLSHGFCLETTKRIFQRGNSKKYLRTVTTNQTRPKNVTVYQILLPYAAPSLIITLHHSYQCVGSTSCTINR